MPILDSIAASTARQGGIRLNGTINGHRGHAIDWRRTLGGVLQKAISINNGAAVLVKLRGCLEFGLDKGILEYLQVTGVVGGGHVTACGLFIDTDFGGRIGGDGYAAEVDAVGAVEGHFTDATQAAASRIRHGNGTPRIQRNARFPISITLPAPDECRSMQTLVQESEDCRVVDVCQVTAHGFTADAGHGLVEGELAVEDQVLRR